MVQSSNLPGVVGSRQSPLSLEAQTECNFVSSTLSELELPAFEASSRRSKAKRDKLATLGMLVGLQKGVMMFLHQMAVSYYRCREELASRTWPQSRAGAIFHVYIVCNEFEPTQHPEIDHKLCSCCTPAQQKSTADFTQSSSQWQSHSSFAKGIFIIHSCDTFASQLAGKVTHYYQHT